MANNRTFLVDMLPKNSVGAEIGVWQGKFSETLLREVKPAKLFLVDPWQWVIPGNIPKDYYIASTKVAKNQADMDELYEKVKHKFENNDNVLVIRKPSTMAACGFYGDDLDWAYIDGAHDYDNVIADLKAWAPKIKMGGLLTCDDWDWGSKYKHPVRCAINDFIKKGSGMFEVVIIKNGQWVGKRIK